MTVLDSVLTILSGNWKPAHQVRAELVDKGHKYMSESATTARIRDLRKNGVEVLCRKNGAAWEYTVPCGAQRSLF